MHTTPPRRLSRPLAALAAAALLAAPPGCAVNPATGQRQFDVLSREQEIALGSEAQPELIAQYGGPVSDYESQAYVSEVGMSLVEHVEADYGELPWEFTLLDSDQVNAFALPGGKVFITRGLARRLDSEAELAGVLAHEVGHVTAEHADQRVSQQFIISGIVVGATAAAGQSDQGWIQAGVPLLVGAGGQGFLLKWSRGEELEADSLGLRYMTRAGYDPRGLVGVMEALADASGGGGRGLEFLSTHPHPDTRIEELRQAIDEDYPQSPDGEWRQGAERYENRLLDRLQSAPET